MDNIICRSNSLNDLKLLSVIIPAYNSEKFLLKCVESVVNQTYQNIEIIIVDDGSQDSTPQICDELANKFNNIKIIHQENKGLAQTRRAGFNASCGEYIAFVDSDDYIDLNAYAKVIKVLEDNDCDIVQFGYYRVDADGNIIDERRWPHLELNNSHDVFKYFAEADAIVWYTWDKIYRRELFFNIEWPSTTRAEDYFRTPQLFAKAEKFMALPYILYYYVQHKDSTNRNAYADKRKLEDLIKAYSFIVEFTQQKFPKFLPEILWRKLNRIIAPFTNYRLIALDDYHEVLDGLHEKICGTDARLKEELKRRGFKRVRLKSYNFKKRIKAYICVHFPKLVMLKLKIIFAAYKLKLKFKN